jgi:transitional endoplasmic reticulum ATPase
MADGAVKKSPLKEAFQEYDWAARDTEIHREGSRIVLPKDPVDMTYESGIAILERAAAAENMIYAINEAVPVHFFDGIVALYEVMKKKYGYVGTSPKQTWFGPIPPKLMHVKVGPRPQDFVQVPYGQFKLPNVEGVIETKYAVQRGIPVLMIMGEVKSKEKKIVMELVNETVAHAKANSIYKGRAVVLERDEGGGVDLSSPLEYFDPYLGKEIPIFNKETELLIETAVLAPISNSEECRKHGVPLKRGVLLEGPYGTGKSLTARQAARVAGQHGWTFLNVTSAKALPYALRFAKIYQPCVIFAEDIDRLTASRNEGANDLINMIDGVVGKSDEIITVLTTNFVQLIDKAMLRPGRLDAVISLRAPDEEAVQRLIRSYVGDLMDKDVDVTPASVKLSGNIPATIREVCERAKLAMITRGGNSINTNDLLVSAVSMDNHLKILNDAKEGQAEPTINDTLKDLIVQTLNEIIPKKFDSDILTGD